MGGRPVWPDENFHILFGTVRRLLSSAAVVAEIFKDLLLSGVM